MTFIRCFAGTKGTVQLKQDQSPVYGDRHPGGRHPGGRHPGALVIIKQNFNPAGEKVMVLSA